MGLDMYMYRKTYVKNWDHTAIEERYDITIKRGGKESTIKSPRIETIVEEVMYWRKANQIHNWFVNNVQDGEDDCKEYWVSLENLQRLLDVCIEVRDSLQSSDKETRSTIVGTIYSNGNKEHQYEDIEFFLDTSIAEDLLPPTEGFFFGGYEINQWYLEQVEGTIESLEGILSEDNSDSNFYYNSSW